ncbi:hypothetical protein K469DRAFT_321057 [Zopfia rhizophila CBS 207.26]|uniref:Uncharacterized protein n=1 Tax=Zopfia rhizophila CBS 207.26 TaxID=1314779 RepID=A0A6A6DM50_9PEZI|nr:hypothetical protein K469DRAFT_321057 [Zopfia rhizophila CBS 207.26]
MALAYEWNQLAVHRKSLRVTKHAGHQRATYFLPLPFQWNIPLNGLSGLLHWLALQTLFVVRLDQLDRAGKPRPGQSVGACGSSSSAVWALILQQFCILVLFIVLACISFDAQIPLAGSGSWVISAARHAKSDEVDPAIGKVKWGVVDEKIGPDGSVSYCRFSSGQVKRLKLVKDINSHSEISTNPTPVGHARVHTY